MIDQYSIKRDIFRVVRFGEYENFISLLNSVQNVNEEDELRCSLLFYASGRPEDGDEFVKALLDKGANPNQSTADWNRPVNNAVWHGGSKALKLLLSHGGKIDQQHLFHACNKETFILIAGQLQLALSAQNIWSDLLFSSAQRGNCNHIIEGIYSYGIKNLDYRDAEMNTPLMIAIKNQNIETAKKLISFGSDVNATNGIGTTPLIFYVRSQLKIRPVFLIDAGANIYHKNKAGKDAIQISQKTSELCYHYLLAIDNEQNNIY